MESRGRVRGYNHNFRYRGSVLHVQSEASGSDRLQVTTQLFLGGTVLASRRKSLETGASVEDMDATMRSQHKDVLRELCRGALDETLARLLGAAELPDAASAEPSPSPMSSSASSSASERDHVQAESSSQVSAEVAARTRDVAAAPEPSCPGVSPPRRRALPSYRHSIRRRGLLLGVRTLDLGPERAEIVTELLHGTSILAIRRSSYETDQNAHGVVAAMQEQHKAVLHKVRRGGFDPRLPIFAAEPLHASHR